MWFHSLFDTLLARSSRTPSRKRRPAPRVRQHPRSFRPLLEILEDRSLLSTYTVNALTDTGAGSGPTGDLRYCVTNATSGNDSIDFAAGLTGTIQLKSALPALAASVAIQGPGSNLLTVSGAGVNVAAVFYVDNGAHVQISGLSIANAGIATEINTAAALTISNSTVSESGISNGGFATISYSTLSGSSITNYSSESISYSTISGYTGYAIDNSGNLTVSNSTLSGNGDATSYGGAITNSGSATVSNSTISGNYGVEYGAILNRGNLTLNNSTISGNTVHGSAGGYGSSGGLYPGGTGLGAGIFMFGGTLSINSSTIANNEAIGGSSGFVGSYAGDGEGGGLYINGGTVTINNSTLAGNQAIGGAGSSPGLGYGGGIDNAAGAAALQMHDTIVADDTANTAPDLSGGVTSLGHNLIGNSAGGSGYAASDLVNVNPQLGPLQNNGGPTQTMALLSGSPAIDAGDNSNAPAYDQRGPNFARIVNGTIDIGAFEVQNSTITAAAASTFTITGFPSPCTSGAAGIFTVTAYDANGNVATGYTGTVHFSSSDPLAVLPADATLSNGSGIFAATLTTAGYQSITATDTQNSALTGSQTGIQVLPLATITGPSTGYLNQTLRYTLGASGDLAGTNYTFAINWGDGSAVQTITGPSGTTVSHSYSTSAARSIAVTATDPGGFTSDPIYQSVNIVPVSVAVETDPANTSQQTLIIDGSANSDNIVLGNGANNGVTLTFDGIALGNFLPANGNPFALVVVLGEGGNDIMDARNLSISSVLVGGSGNDTLYGSSGRNLLIGGSGSDTLYAGSAGDILIGGSTSYDSNLTALAFIMAEWDRTDVSYSTRVKQLNGSLSGGLNGSYVLNSNTVHDDNAIDTLYGGAGTDWYFAHLKGKNVDKINGQTSGEVITGI